MKLILFFALVVLLFIQTGAIGQEVTDPLALFDEKKVWYNGYTETWFQFFGISEGDVRKSIEEWEGIGRESRTAPNDLAGTYASGGSTHGDYLRLSPTRGFVWLSVNKCMGGPMRIRRGRVESFAGGMRLITETTHGNAEGHGTHSHHDGAVELLAVGWMGTTYLVPKKELASFADYVARLGEFNGYLGFVEGSPFLFGIDTSSDVENPKFEMPVYPVGYDRFSKQPIRGRVDRILKTTRVIDRDSETHDDLFTILRVLVDNPTGLKRDMHLLAVDTNQSLIEKFAVKSIKGNVVTVEHTRPIVKKTCISRPDWDCKDLDYITIKKGMLLSTNGY